MSIKLGIIGGGVMGEALLSRLIAQKIYQPSEVLVSEPVAQRRDFLAREYGVELTSENRLAASATEVLLLAIKPQVFATVTAGLQEVSVPVVISILAGMPLSKLEAAFPGKAAIRVMPNMPATVGAGMTAIAPGSATSADQVDLARKIFAAVGEVAEVPEYLMDAVTGLSGSGPAYVAILIEALSDGGVRVGLPRAIASQLALQTVLGTAQLIKNTGLYPTQLKDRMTSPGGTTIAGIAKLEQAGFRSALIEAVTEASRRSTELGN